MVFGVGFKAKNIPSFSVNTSSLVLWLRADAGVLWIPSPGFGGGGVYQWTDQSGRGNNFTQTTTANQPVYFSGGIGSPNGQPYILFNGTSNILKSANVVTSATSNWTQFIVIKVVSASLNTVIFSTGEVSGFGFEITSTPARAVLSGGVGGEAFGATTTSWEVWANWDTSGVNTTCQVNGVATSSAGNITPGAASAPSVLGNNGGAAFLNGSLAEVIIFARTLAAGELLSVNSYLMSKYGI